MAILETVTTQLSQVFLSPWMFLFGLLGIPAVLLLYFVRKQPEEEVMPSMMFFMEKEGDSSASAALRFLKRNLMLLLHLLLVLGFATAAAEPFFETEEVPEKAVVILDASASMQDDFSEAKSFARGNLGRTNTVLIVGEEPRLVAEEVSRERAESIIQGAEVTGERTDVAGALDRAGRFEGEIVLASDGDQSVDSSGVVSRVESLRDSGRNVLVPEFGEDGQEHGVTDVRVSPTEYTVEVANLGDEPRNITVSSGQESRTLSLLPGASGPATFPATPGVNEVTLPEDGVNADDTAFASYPRNRDFRVLHVAEKEDRFLRAAVREISFTEYDRVEPPLDSVPEADIYFLGRSDRILSDSIERIESRTQDGGGLVVTGRKGLRAERYDSLPVSGTGAMEKTDVEVREPVRASVANTSVLGFSSVEGNSISRPRRALVRSGYGEGEVLLFNLNSSDFGPSFVYPVFWKRVFQEMVDRHGLSELNIGTGDAVNASRVVLPDGKEVSGFVRTRDAGVYNTSSGLYAVNLESRDESVDEVELSRDDSQGEVTKTDRNMQSLASLGVAFLLLGELAFLRRLGEL